MKKYNDEHMEFETQLLPSEFVALLQVNKPIIDDFPTPVDYPLDEHELAMAA